MHIVGVATLIMVLTLVGVEFSVFAFVNPAAWRLSPEPQLKMLSRFAFVLGRVMPIWYPLCAVLLVTVTWLHWQDMNRHTLIAADVLWVIASLASIIFLVPLNNKVAEGASDWHQAHRLWDMRHRMRVGLLAIAAVLLSYALVG